MRLTRRSFIIGACALPIAAKAAAVESLLPAPQIIELLPMPPMSHVLDAMRYANIGQRTALWAARDMVTHARLPLVFRRIHVPYDG